MCTAVTYLAEDFYFGRNLDYEFSYGENVVVSPRKYRFRMRKTEDLDIHFAIIGMAHVSDGYPLYYDAVNEHGLCVAGLNFVGNAVLGHENDKKVNVAQFEFVPWLLGKCADVAAAKRLIAKMNMIDLPFRKEIPSAQLHWLIADKNECIVLEITEQGTNIYENSAGVLTNNPSFPAQLFSLNDYMKLSPKEPTNEFSQKIPLKVYSRGMGAIGLPGDLSSRSRFVRAAFVQKNSVSPKGEEASISQVFHILDSVAQPRGCCMVGDEKYEITIYSSCMNADRGIYYYTTYDNRQICAVDMHKEDLDSGDLICYPICTEQKIFFHN